MRRTLVALVLLALAVAAQAVPQAVSMPATMQPPAAPQAGATAQRKIPCKTPENASMCYWTRGRLYMNMSSASFRMWKIGTKRIVDIYNGPSSFPPRTGDDMHNPELPANLERAYRVEVPRLERLQQAMPDWVYGDFEICPLEPEKPGSSQAVCIEAAKNIFFDGSKRLYQ